MKIIGILVSLVFVIVVGSLFSGLVLSILWGWFVVPALHASPITIAQAIGFSLVVGMLTRGIGSREKSDEEQKRGMGEVLFTAFLLATIPPLFVLGIGAIVHVFA